MTGKAVVAGHVCLDVIPQIDHHFEPLPGRLYEVGPPIMGTGGTVSNTGVALHRLGIPTVLMGKIGDDSFGKTVLDIFRQLDERLIQGMKVDPAEHTSYTVVVNIPQRDRTFLHCFGANNTFTAADLDVGELADATLFHFGYPPLMRSMFEDGGKELQAVLRTAREAGAATSLDMAMPDPDGLSGKADWEAILTRSLPEVDIFLPSADELLFMLQRELYGQGDELNGDQVSRLGQRLIDLGVGVAGLKLGHRGLYVRTAGPERLAKSGRLAEQLAASAWADRELWFPCFEVAGFVGATGAGDTTIAGFLAGLLRGQSPEEAGTSATMVGAMNCQAADSLSGLRDWGTTQAAAAATARQSLTVAGVGWKFDAAAQLWRGPDDRD